MNTFKQLFDSYNENVFYVNSNIRPVPMQGGSKGFVRILQYFDSGILIFIVKLNYGYSYVAML